MSVTLMYEARRLHERFQAAPPGDHLSLCVQLMGEGPPARHTLRRFLRAAAAGQPSPVAEEVVGELLRTFPTLCDAPPSLFCGVVELYRTGQLSALPAPDQELFVGLLPGWCGTADDLLAASNLLARSPGATSLGGW